MRVLVACEFSGIVRDAFIAKGHNAISCDKLPSERPGPHLQCGIFDVLSTEWDLLIAFPPCTHLAISGARHFKDKHESQRRALLFVQRLLDAPIPRICLENPVSIISTRIRKPEQIIQPFQFGHNEQKRTCLWLKNLPPLVPTRLMPGRVQRTFYMDGHGAWRDRSRTYTGIAKAMAAQWGLEQ